MLDALLCHNAKCIVIYTSILNQNMPREIKNFVGVFCKWLVILRPFSLTAATEQQVNICFDFSSLDSLCTCSYTNICSCEKVN